MTAPTLQALPETRCPLCGGANQCAPAQAGRLDVECWCSKAVISPAALARVPADKINKACLCPRCAAAVDAGGVED
ncbi:MAG TPA: DNA or RNA helicase of superfamily II [Moraxellaceae bacterium]|nr:DNA or RNA helicase of superfamily II [Moraxellaceae bacterium]